MSKSWERISKINVIIEWCLFLHGHRLFTLVHMYLKWLIFFVVAYLSFAKDRIRVHLNNQNIFNHRQPTCSATCCSRIISAVMTSRRATTLTVMPSSPLTLNDPGWKHATMSLRFDRVVCTASLRPSLTMSHRSSVKTGPPDSNRCLDRERSKVPRRYLVWLLLEEPRAFLQWHCHVSSTKVTVTVVTRAFHQKD